MFSKSEAEILLSHIIAKPREHVFAHPGIRLASADARRFKLFCKKRASGIPLAYLTRRTEFFSLDLYIDERCFIPRPETELLVELALNECKGRKNLFILDLGAGSGAIVIALAKNLPSSKFVAADVSEKALKVAQINIKRHELGRRISIKQSDLLGNLQGFDFDGIVANLPYIGTERFSFVEKSVCDHEPNIALFGGADGLRLYEKLFSQIIKHKKYPKFIIGEFGFAQQKTLHKMLKSFFQRAEIYFHNDLAGIPRAFMIKFS